MSESISPREVYERFLRSLAARDWDDLFELYAEDVVVDVPFAPGKPVRITGREALREHFAAMERRPVEIRVEDLVIHETADPEVFVAEFDYDGRVTDSGREFHVANIVVARVRDGRIVESRDYHNHLAIVNAMGQLPAMVEALTAAA
jgi:ketosteroid isomerase-like protein